MAQPQLPDACVNQIDQEVNKHRKALIPGVGVPSWLMSVGALISEWLPDIIAVLQAIAQAGTTKTPTLLDFSKKCCEMFEPKPAAVPAAAHPVAKPAGT